MKLVVIDTDVLVIDEVYTRDNRYKDNRDFLDVVGGYGATTVYNVLELTGIIAVATGKNPLEFFWKFHDEKGLRVLYPPDMNGPYLHFNRFILRVLERIARGMKFGDAKILTLAEAHNADVIVTWNKRHYRNKTNIPVLTPAEYIKQQLLD